MSKEQKNKTFEELDINAKDKVLLEYVNEEMVTDYAQAYDVLTEEARALDIDFSAMDKKMYAEINQMVAKEKKQKSFHSMKKAAVIILVFLTACSITIGGFAKYSVAFKAKLYDLFGKQEEKAMNFEFGAEESIPENWQGKYAPTKLPPGYQLTEASVLGHSYCLEYENGAGRLIRLQCIENEAAISVDSEDCKISEVYINDASGTAFEKNDGTSTTILWSLNEQGVVFNLYSDLPLDALIKIAESIALIHY